MPRTSPLAVVLLTCLPSLSLAAPIQGPPGTDIWVVDLAVRNGRATLAAPVNVTSRPGYDNQPAFLPDGTGLLYTVIGADGQADVWRYHFAARHARPVTTTPESEYSPTPLPAAPGFSTVRVEADSTQRLWRFALDGSDPALVLERLQPVGYHAWADAQTLALFVLGTPNALVIANPRTGRADTVARDIGRALQPVPGRAAVSFVQRVDTSEAWLAEADAATRGVRRLIRLPRGAEFHVWVPGSRPVVLTTDGATLLQWDGAPGGAWVPVADLGALGLRGVSRLAVSPRADHLALVARDPAP